jgi:arylsulfatase A-like enzyme
MLAGCGGRSEEGPGPSRPKLAGGAKGWNVLLLTIDTLRADRLGAYGDKERPNSPNLDRLLASVLTGLYPQAHGVVENGYGFPDDLPTLPKLLHAKGYRTGAFLSNMCQANHKGWDDFACSGGQDGKTVRRALEWAQKQTQGQPFFLWVHLFGGHGPYYNGGDYADRVLDPGYEGPVGPKKWQLNRIMTERIPLGPRDIHHLDALYDAAVTGTDRQAGTLLDGLRAAGKLDRTLIVLTADHGEELYDHNQYLYHACSVFQTGLHVPLGIVAPGLVAGGGRVPQRVELIDITPTLLSLVDAVAPAEMHGASLVPYLERPGGGGAGKPAFSEYGSTRIRTVARGSWKLIENPDGIDPVCIPDAPPHHYPIGKAELYDLAADPMETKNLAATRPDLVAELARLIQKRFASVANRARPQDVSKELKEELKGLGYVGH